MGYPALFPNHPIRFKKHIEQIRRKKTLWSSAGVHYLWLLPSTRNIASCTTHCDKGPCMHALYLDLTPSTATFLDHIIITRTPAQNPLCPKKSYPLASSSHQTNPSPCPPLTHLTKTSPSICPSHHAETDPAPTNPTYGTSVPLSRLTNRTDGHRGDRENGV